MCLEDSFEAILDGEAILFIGSGFSKTAKNEKSEKLPGSWELSENMQKEMKLSDIDGGRNIHKVSELFIDRKGAEALVNFIKAQFSVKSVTDIHQNFASYDWSQVYTTNYDNVLEYASDLVGNHRIGIDLSDKVSVFSSRDNNKVIHLNGFIDKINSKNIYTSTKLTNYSYTNDNLFDSEWITKISIDIEHSRAIFFVGLSLDSDLDISRLLSSNNVYKKKIYFVNGKNMDEFNRASLEKYGTVLNEDAESFIEKLSDFSENYSPKKIETKQTWSFDKIEEKKIGPVAITDSSISKLLFYGQVDDNLAYLYSGMKGKYLCYRSAMKQVLDCIESNNFDLIICHSKFGNGKTLFLKNIEYVLAKNKYLIYRYNGNPNYIKQDLDILNTIDAKKIIITVDDYYSIKSELKYFINLDKERFTVIVTGRSALHQNNENSLIEEANFSTNKSVSIVLDSLYEEEAGQVYSIIENHNLWGEKSKESAGRKRKVIKNDGKKGLSQVMLNVIKSNYMFQTLEKIYTSLDDELKDIVITVLINNIISSKLNLAQILRLLGKNNLTLEQSNNPDFREFIDFASNRIVFNSSIASKKLLNEEKDKKKIMILMSRLMRKADTIDYGKTYFYLKRELVSFSNFRLIFANMNSQKRNSLAVEFFESVKNTTFAKENPFFWLQYAIQKLDQKDYDLAETFFDNAYSYSDKRNYSDNYQIDTHKARFLIESSIGKKISVLEALKNFEEAHSILMNSAKNPKNDPFYAYRHGALYYDFFVNFKDQMTSEQIIKFQIQANIMKKNIEDYIRNWNDVPWQTKNSIEKLSKIR